LKIARYLIATLFVGLFLAGFDLFWYGRFLIDFYTQTNTIWRSQTYMNGFYPYIISNFIAFSLLITFLYTSTIKEKGLKGGIYFGFITGLFIAIREFQAYPYLPVPLIMAVYWSIGSHSGRNMWRRHFGAS